MATTEKIQLTLDADQAHELREALTWAIAAACAKREETAKGLRDLHRKGVKDSDVCVRLGESNYRYYSNIVAQSEQTLAKLAGR
jgi:hypothetical protein